MKSNLKKIYLFRHGDVEDRYKKRFRGVLDVELSPLGQRMSEANAQFLKKQKIEVVITSGLKRTDAVGKLCQSLGVPHEVEPRFREVDFGAWEGLSWSEVGERYPSMAATYKTKFDEMVFPDGESVFDLKVRLAAAWKTVVERSESSIAIIGHSTGNGCLISQFTQTPFDQVGMQLLGSYHLIEAHPQRASVIQRNIQCFNEEGYLVDI